MNRFLIRLAISLIAVLIAIVACLMAVGYFTIALFFLLLEYVAPALAALGTGIGILVIAAVVIMAARVMTMKTRLPPPRSTAENAAQFGGILGRKLHDYANAHKGPAAAAALLVGFAVGVSPKLRTFLRDILKV